MINTDKKYLEKREGDRPSVGNFVHWYILELKLKKKNIADKLEILPTTAKVLLKAIFAVQYCMEAESGDEV